MTGAHRVLHQDSLNGHQSNKKHSRIKVHKGNLNYLSKIAYSHYSFATLYYNGNSSDIAQLPTVDNPTIPSYSFAANMSAQAATISL